MTCLPGLDVILFRLGTRLPQRPILNGASYALIEREIVWHFNDIQTKCYVLLKSILKECLDASCQDDLSSYAIKTCLFWLAETKDPSIWREDNLLSCLNICIATILRHVTETNIPHYIVPSNNILLTKFQDAIIHTSVLGKLEEVLRWHWSDLFRLKPLKNLFEVWEKHGSDISHFLRVSRYPNAMPFFYHDLISFRSYQAMYININDFSEPVTRYKKTLDLLEDCPADIDEHLVKFLKIVIGGRVRFMSPTLADHLSTQLESPDVCTKLLREAIAYFVSGRLEEAKCRLKEILYSYKPHVLYIGLCGPEETSLNDITEYLCYTTTSGELSPIQKIQQCLALDFVICKTDLLPPVLQAIVQMWDEDEVPICVHPKILTYYLLTLVLFIEGKKEDALASLLTLSENVKIASTKAHDVYMKVAWTLLGHACFALQKREQAYYAFRMSLKETVSHNPAIYLICCLVI